MVNALRRGSLPGWSFLFVVLMIAVPGTATSPPAAQIGLSANRVFAGRAMLSVAELAEPGQTGPFGTVTASAARLSIDERSGEVEGTVTIAFDLARFSRDGCETARSRTVTLKGRYQPVAEGQTFTRAAVIGDPGRSTSKWTYTHTATNRSRCAADSEEAVTWWADLEDHNTVAIYLTRYTTKAGILARLTAAPVNDGTVIAVAVVAACEGDPTRLAALKPAILDVDQFEYNVTTAGMTDVAVKPGEHTFAIRVDGLGLSLSHGYYRGNAIQADALGRVKVRIDARGQRDELTLVSVVPCAAETGPRLHHRVIAVSGTPIVYRAGQSLPLTPGFRIYSGDVVRTDRGQAVLIDGAQWQENGTPETDGGEHRFLVHSDTGVTLTVRQVPAPDGGGKLRPVTRYSEVHGTVSLRSRYPGEEVETHETQTPPPGPRLPRQGPMTLEDLLGEGQPEGTSWTWMHDRLEKRTLVAVFEGRVRVRSRANPADAVVLVQGQQVALSPAGFSEPAIAPAAGVVDFGNGVRIDLSPAPNRPAPAPSVPPGPATTYGWMKSGTGDCSGHDVGQTLSASEPDRAVCALATLGLVAVCWDGATWRNAGRPGAWCTYKHLSGKPCTGGSNPGTTYACVAIDR